MPVGIDFAQLQAAWEALRTDDSRAVVDAVLKNADTAMQTAQQLAADVDLDDMDFTPEECDGMVEGIPGGVYSYRCRCGDKFVVTE